MSSGNISSQSPTAINLTYVYERIRAALCSQVDKPDQTRYYFYQTLFLYKTLLILQNIRQFGRKYWWNELIASK